jgi:acetyl-CoA synthetase
MSKTHEVKTHAVKKDFAARAYIDEAGYAELYKQSIEDNEGFWAEQASCIDWIKPFSKIKDVSYAEEAR